MNFDQGFRAKGLALLTLALVFGSGIGIGLAFDRNLNAGIPDSADTEEAPRRGRNAPREPRAMIVEGVGLTLEQ